ncbi:MAG: class I tRNA ligase family protein, partial [Planctomycetes bacterium]|nr:class I tRNA ligase family protein [Planctomycetota bacterium]
PIIEDDYVVLPDPEATDEKARFSSGFLKVTPAHDPNDWEIGRRFSLPVINVMAPDGSISREHGWPVEEFDSGDAAAAEAFLGQSREDARKGIVKWFKENGLLEEIKPYRHAVGHSYRSHAPVEPYLSDQWYVRVTHDRLAGAALRAMSEDQRSDSDGCIWKKGSSFSADGESSASEWEGRLRFHPTRYAKVFQAWHENIRDWCISRQLWWGHRIPVWSASEEATFDAKIFDGRVAEQVVSGKRYVCVRQADDSDLISSLEAAGFERDEDVLDTWFSSALWPMSTMGWPEPEAFPDDIPEGGALLDRWNPSNTLGTAREIITLWVSRMVMFNLYFRNCLSFNDVFIHAMIQDGEGQKMSKSLGNGVDPLDIVHTHGADAMRFTLASMATDMQDVRMPVDLVCPFTGEMFAPTMTTNQAGYRVAAPVQVCPSDSNKKIITSYGVASNEATPSDSMPLARNTSSRFDYGRNFANKLWNAVRFALGVLESAGEMGAKDVDPSALTQTDQWILSRLRSTIEEADRALERFEFSVYAQSLYSFTWHDLCDWYIEAVKPTVREDAAQRQVLASCIDATLRLLHPAMPFVTERLWERLNQIAPERGVVGLEIPCDALLVNSAWPKAHGDLADESAEREFDLIQKFVGAIREVRATHKVPPRQKIVCTGRAPAELASRLNDSAVLIGALAAVELSEFGPDVVAPERAGSTVVSEVEIYLHDLVDKDAERQRLERLLGDLGKRQKNLSSRLSNESYVKKAPKHLVQQTRDELAEVEKEIAALDVQLKGL